MAQVLPSGVAAPTPRHAITHVRNNPESEKASGPDQKGFTSLLQAVWHYSAVPKGELNIGSAHSEETTHEYRSLGTRSHWRGVQWGWTDRGCCNSSRLVSIRRICMERFGFFPHHRTWWMGVGLRPHRHLGTLPPVSSNIAVFVISSGLTCVLPSVKRCTEARVNGWNFDNSISRSTRSSQGFILSWAEPTSSETLTTKYKQSQIGRKQYQLSLVS